MSPIRADWFPIDSGTSIFVTGGSGHLSVAVNDHPRPKRWKAILSMICPMIFSKKYDLAFLLMLALAVRVAYCVSESDSVGPMASEVERAAACIARKGMVGDVFGEGTGPSAHVAPLYPLLLSFVYRVFGADGPARRLAEGVMASLFASLGIALLIPLGRSSRLSPKAGLLAAIAMAIIPINLWIETYGGFEHSCAAAASVTLLAAGACAEADGWRSRSRATAIGALLGIAGLLSPVVLFAAVAVIVVGACSGPIVRAAIANRACALIVAALVVLPWVGRNYAVFHKFIPIRGNLGLELWVGNAQWREWDTNPRWEPPHPSNDRSELEALIELGEAKYADEKMKSALAWMKEHPGEFAGLTARRFSSFWFPPTSIWWHPTGRSTWFKSLFLCSLSTLALLGLVRLLAVRHPFGWAVLTFLLCFSLPYAFTQIYLRYRYPVTGILFLLAADFVLQMRRHKSGWSHSASVT
jgi:hypothetical protein